MPEIRFNKASVEGRELVYVRASIESGHTSSGGPFSARAAALLAEQTGAQEVLLTTSCTAALERSAMLLDQTPRDTVIVPSFTFTTAALAFARQGARLLFCDIEPHTLGLDPEHMASLLDETVRAVVPVHYVGVSCDVEGIHSALVDWPDVAVVEDNTHGLFSTWRGEPLGSLGRFTAQIFNDTKNFVCGEGGTLLLNEARDVARACVLFDKGTNRRAFLLGQVDKYLWKDTDNRSACLTPWPHTSWHNSSGATSSRTSAGPFTNGTRAVSLRGQTSASSNLLRFRRTAGLPTTCSMLSFRTWAPGMPC